MSISEVRKRVARRYANELGVTVAAKRFGLATTQFSDMIAEPPRKSFGEKVARKMELAFDPERPPGWLDVDEGVAIGTAHAATPISSDIRIPEYDTGGSMGTGIVLADQPGVIKEWRVSDRWAQENVHRVTSYSNLAIVTGFGPSMQPLFNPGDPLLVDRGIKRADIDGIYFFRVGDEGFVKQIQRIPTEDGLIYRAKSYNPLYDSFDISKKMDFEVFARVIKVWKSEDF